MGRGGDHCASPSSSDDDAPALFRRGSLIVVLQQKQHAAEATVAAQQVVVVVLQQIMDLQFSEGHRSPPCGLRGGTEGMRYSYWCVVQYTNDIERVLMLDAASWRSSTEEESGMMIYLELFISSQP